MKVDWRSVETMSEERELAKVEEWLSSFVGNRECAIVEIGSFKGASTALLTQFGKVLAIDLWGNVDFGLEGYEEIGQHHFVAFIQNMIRLKLIDRVFPLVATSDVLKWMPYLAFDIALIDGCHTYEAVKKDILNVLPHMLPNSVITMDDYKRPGWGYPPYDLNHPHHGPVDPWAGVAKAVDEFIAAGDLVIVDHYLGRVLLKKG